MLNLRTLLPRPLRHLLLPAVALLLLATALPALGAETVEAADASVDDGKSWLAFFGRLHVVVLHLPIGLIIGAFALEILGLFKRSRGYDVAAAWMLVLGALSAWGAVGTGLLLGSEDLEGIGPIGLLFADADEGVSDTLQLHMWLGVSIALVASVAAVLKMIAIGKQWPDKKTDEKDPGGLPLVLARVSLIGLMTALPLAGHYGGNMTHGSEFLFAKAPFTLSAFAEGVLNPASQAASADGTDGGQAEQASNTWNDVIQPALNAHCITCHGETKQNAKMRLDSLAEAMKKPGVIEPGDAEFSELYRRVTLPSSHIDFMPPNVEKHGRLNPEVVITIGEWIQQFDGNAQEPDGPEPDGADGQAPGPSPANARPRLDPAMLRGIADAGGSAQSLSQEEDPDLLDVKFSYKKNLDPQALDALAPAAGQVAWLTFDGSSVNDAGIDRLPNMPKLTRLNLKDTAVTDAGLAALPAMPNLAWLNLFGTPITDAGLKHLERFTSLDKLYVTGTGVTAEGVAQLRAALPEAEIYSDFDAEFQFDGAPPAAATAADAEPVNTVCPVSGVAVNAGFTSTFEGRTIGFCCGDCKAKFDADPAAFVADLP